MSKVRKTRPSGQPPVPPAPAAPPPEPAPEQDAGQFLVDDGKQYEHIECEYVYLDEKGNPIDIPLGTYSPEDFEEAVVEVHGGGVDLAEMLTRPRPAGGEAGGHDAAHGKAPEVKPAPRSKPIDRSGVPPLELKSVWRGYQSGAGRVEVLKDVSLKLSSGELVIVAGPSGSGKSTLLSVMGGLLRADRGEVRVLGRDVTGLSEPGLQEVRRKNFGFIFQNIYLMAALSASENVRVALDIKTPGHDGNTAKIAARLLGLVGMTEYAHRLPRALSGGQCQRVAVARALAAGPKIILADEPTAALDTENALSVMKLLKDLTVEEGLATAVVTHDVRLFQFADRVLSLDGGRLREARKQ